MGSGYAALLGTALAWSFSGIFTKLNSQEGFLISAVSSAVALAFYLLIIRPTIGSRGSFWPPACRPAS